MNKKIIGTVLCLVTISSVKSIPLTDRTFIAHRDELGIEPPILKIQVKAHDGNIGADPVKSFAAMIPDRDVGVFITTGGYSASALDFARTRSNIRLLNGLEFIALIQKHYDQLDPRRRRQIPLRRVLVPDVGGADGEA